MLRHEASGIPYSVPVLTPWIYQVPSEEAQESPVVYFPYYTVTTSGYNTETPEVFLIKWA